MIIMTMQNKRLAIILLSVALLLLIPFTAMQFTGEVNWSTFDFLAMGFILLCTGLLCELVLQKVKKMKNRIALIVAIMGALLLVWAELAVGVFGTVFAGS